jgi:16S rRNA (guanine527-N7)-methyltransferase
VRVCPECLERAPAQVRAPRAPPGGMLWQRCRVTGLGATCVVHLAMFGARVLPRGIRRHEEARALVRFARQRTTRLTGITCRPRKRRPQAYRPILWAPPRDLWSASMASAGGRALPHGGRALVTRLGEALEALALSPSLEIILNNFGELLVRWNHRINLTAARTAPEIHEHIVDSLQVVLHLRASDEQARHIRVLDVGAGGGLPSVVAAICLPDAHVIALEPVHKKHAFLRTAARELSLSNLEPFAERLERHSRHDYDVAMSRAAFDLREWLLLGASHVRAGGLVLGFEAIPRSDLPHGTVRHCYELAGKARAIVAFRTPTSIPTPTR